MVCDPSQGGSNRIGNKLLGATAEAIEALTMPLVNELVEEAQQRDAQRAAEARKKEEERERRLRILVHNLRSLNAKSRQALNLIITEDALSSASDKKRAIRDALSRNAASAARAVMSVLKSVSLTATDIRAWEHLMDGSTFSRRQRSSHPIHKVAMLTGNVFWQDFDSRDIRVDYGSSTDYVSAHFETFSAGLTLLMENAAKYCAPGSRITFSYATEIHGRRPYIVVRIAMRSMYVEPDEREQIWTEGYSGREAAKTARKGSGIGLSVALALFRMGDAHIDMLCGDICQTMNGVRFADNEYQLRVPVA